MYSEIERAINLLASNITVNTNADDALKYTQAALNLAHAEVTLKGCDGLAARS